MKYLLITIGLLLCCCNTFAQKLKVEKRVTDHSVYVKGDGFEGVIFDTVYKDKHLSIEGNKRFSPSSGDIIGIENILKEKLDDVTKKYDQQFIQKHLRKYVRQYLGLITNKNEKVIFVNFLWKEGIEKEEEIIKLHPEGNVSWLKGWQTVFDGGNYYWQIKINLSTNELFDFGVNGEA